MNSRAIRYKVYGQTELARFAIKMKPRDFRAKLYEQNGAHRLSTEVHSQYYKMLNLSLTKCQEHSQLSRLIHLKDNSRISRLADSLSDSICIYHQPIDFIVIKWKSLKNGSKLRDTNRAVPWTGYFTLEVPVWNVLNVSNFVSVEQTFINIFIKNKIHRWNEIWVLYDRMFTVKC